MSGRGDPFLISQSMRTLKLTWIRIICPAWAIHGRRAGNSLSGELGRGISGSVAWFVVMMLVIEGGCCIFGGTVKFDNNHQFKSELPTVV